jgi:hypothetical protein
MDDPRTTVIDVGSIVPPREIAVIWHRDRAASEAVTAFVALADELGSKLEKSPETLDSRRSATA